MKIWTVLLLLTLTLGWQPVRGAVQVPPHDGYLVELAPDAPVPLAEGTMEYVLPGVYRVEEAELARQLVEAGLAICAEPNCRVELFETAPTAGTAAAAWSWEALGGSRAQALGLTGRGVRVGVIDSGIDIRNPNLTGAALISGRSYGRPEENPLADTVGHGSCVAQMIAGRGVDGAERGLAPEAELVSLRCFYPDQNPTYDSLAAAIYDAVHEFDCDVLNLSWGGSHRSEILERRLLEAADLGVLLLAAAGNSGSSVEMYPAAFDCVVSVGALTPEGTAADFSQRTASLWAAAPGQGLMLTTSGGVCALRGTSFACPGATALTALARELSPGLTMDDWKPLLRTRAADLGSVGWDTGTGWGRITVSGLLDTSWYRSGIGGPEGWLSPGASERVLLAEYTAAGRLNGLELRQAEHRILGLGALKKVQSGGSRLYLLDSVWTPLTGMAKE